MFRASVLQPSHAVFPGDRCSFPLSCSTTVFGHSLQCNRTEGMKNFRRIILWLAPLAVFAFNYHPITAVTLNGQAGSVLNVEYANAVDSPLNWLLLGAVTLTSPPEFCFDLSTPLPPERFYRAWQTGTPGVIRSLNLNMVPAITLTGNIGDQLQVDYISQFGPTNAWVTLGTVTLTNTSQLYFDLSAPDQPARLYRIVPLP